MNITSIISIIGTFILHPLDVCFLMMLVGKGIETLVLVRNNSTNTVIDRHAQMTKFFPDSLKNNDIFDGWMLHNINLCLEQQ
jgi:hypothetical protein